VLRLIPRVLQISGTVIWGSAAIVFACWILAASMMKSSSENDRILLFKQEIAKSLGLLVPDKHLFKWDNKRTGSGTRNQTFQSRNFLDFKWDKKHYQREPSSIAESRPMTNPAIAKSKTSKPMPKKLVIR
jgi:hypothetical protein